MHTHVCTDHHMDIHRLLFAKLPKNTQKNRKKNEEGKKSMNKVRQSSGKKLLAIAALAAYISVYIFIHGIYMSASVNHGNGLF